MSEALMRYPGLKRIVFSEGEITARVADLGREIDAFYPLDEELLMVGLLKGAFVFMSDLARSMSRPSLTVDFLVAALYGEGTDPSRDVRLLYDIEAPIEGRNVLVVEDIVDSGKTLNRICDELSRRAPRSLEICTFLHKRFATDLRYEPRWVGFDAPPDWLVGYGLDLGERYRHLPFIAAVAPRTERGS